MTIHSIGSGTCPLTEKEGDGLTLSFDDGTVTESFLSWKGLRQLLVMKSAQAKKEKGAEKPPAKAEPVVTPRAEQKTEAKPTAPVPAAAGAGNGPAAK